MIDPADNKTRSLLPEQGFRGVNPPMVGWWLAKRVQHVEAEFTSRRWWNGSGWSAPCPIGADDEDAESVRKIASLLRPDQIEWLGLHQPELSYPYLLEAETDELALNASSGMLSAQEEALHLLYGALKEPIENVGLISAMRDDVGLAHRRAGVSFD